jgi:hypothetical protein
MMSEQSSTSLTSLTAISSAGASQTDSIMLSDLGVWATERPSMPFHASFHGVITSPYQSLELSFSEEGFAALQKWIGCVMLIQLQKDALTDALSTIGDLYETQRYRLLHPPTRRLVLNGMGKAGESSTRPGVVVLE